MRRSITVIVAVAFATVVLATGNSNDCEGYSSENIVTETVCRETPSGVYIDYTVTVNTTANGGSECIPTEILSKSSECRRPEILGCNAAGSHMNWGDRCEDETLPVYGNRQHRFSNIDRCVSSQNNTATVLTFTAFYDDGEGCFDERTLLNFKHGNQQDCLLNAVQQNAYCGDGPPCEISADCPEQHVCSEGTCTYNEQSCETDTDCDDSDPCTTEECINRGGGRTTCLYTPTENCCRDAGNCNDGQVCTTDACVENRCVHEAISNCCEVFSDCDDHDACTSDECVDNQCVNTPIAECCTTEVQCDDSDECTYDNCDIETMRCEYTAIKGCCVDDAECDDSDACTADFCSGLSHQCQHDLLPGCCVDDAQCDDWEACTEGSCVDGRCAYSPIADCCESDADCDDDDVCTVDACDLELMRCTFVREENCCVTVDDCGDDNSCTADACVNGWCSYDPAPNCCESDTECDDSNVCTDDTCQGEGTEARCDFAPSADCCVTSSECDDSIFCTDDDCIDNRCRSSGIPGCCVEDSDCDDGNVCTQDSCDLEANQCRNDPIDQCCSSDAECSNGDPCVQATCVEGNECVLTPIDNCCTTQEQCDDGDRCTTDECSAGVCDDPQCVVTIDFDNAATYTPVQAVSPNTESAVNASFNGTLLTPATWGRTVTIRGLRMADRSPANVYIYNSTDARGSNTNDLDLGSPNRECPVPGVGVGAGGEPGQPGENCVDLQNVLVVGTYIGGTRIINDFSPSQGGAILVVESDGPVVLTGLALLDMDPVDFPMITNGITTVQLTSMASGENAFTRVSLPTALQGSYFEISYMGSGAVAEIMLGLSTEACEEITQSPCNNTLVEPNQCMYTTLPESLGCCTENSDCDDGDLCTVDVCNQGFCSNEARSNCCVTAEDCPAPESACLTPICITDNRPYGRCALLFTGDMLCCDTASGCDDGNVCTADTCVNNQCRYDAIDGCCQPYEREDNVESTEPMDGYCDDSDPCTADTCVNNTCVNTAIDGCCESFLECNDSDPCTVDACVNMRCTNTQRSDCCPFPDDCDDGDVCTNNYCDQQAEGYPRCVAEDIPNCCTTDMQCVNDEDPCTVHRCVDNRCVHEELDIPQECCTADLQCDDHRPCTIDTCEKNMCHNERHPTCCLEDCPPGDEEFCACDDGNFCTSDVCSGGECVFDHYLPAECDDWLQCTIDQCYDNQCNHVDTCDDDDACTIEECTRIEPEFDGGVPGSECTVVGAVDCDDSNACTDDSCDPALGCLHDPIDCDDGDFCTTNGCDSDTGCSNQPRDCDDSDPCTVDSCDWQRGCVYAPKMCDDSNPCTADTCDGETGECVHTERECNDFNPCTADACDVETGRCTYVTPDACPQPNDACMISRRDADGVCQEFLLTCDDDDLCTADSCDSATGQCVNTPVDNCCTADADCDDSDPRTDDWCTTFPFAVGQQRARPSCLNIVQAGKCISNDDCDLNQTCGDGECRTLCEFDADCDDGVACTTDACDPIGVCTNTPDEAGVCCGTSLDCDDGDPCTTDFCTDSNVCTNTPRCLTNGNLCLDDAVCTVGGCVLQQTSCDDSNACTLDSCAADVGCTNVETSPCCCQSTADCADTDPCTDEVCDVNNQCIVTHDAGCCSADSDCDDNDACTVDTCADNLCVHTPRNCDDSNACTMDYCDHANFAAPCMHYDIAVSDEISCTVGECDPLTGEITQRPYECPDDPTVDVNVCQLWYCTEALIFDLPDSAETEVRCSVFDLRAQSPEQRCCLENADCDDRDPCTTDRCDGETNRCFFTAVEACCRTSADCDDSLRCTFDMCDLDPESPTANRCKHMDNALCCDCEGVDGPCDTEQCADDSLCTVHECVYDAAYLGGGGRCDVHVIDDCCDCDDDTTDEQQLITCRQQCDDGNPCTMDKCENRICWNLVADPESGCCNTDAECDDQNPCTQDQCKDNECVHLERPGCCLSAADCDDADACSIDQCKENNACEYTDLAVPDECCRADDDCPDDGDVCTAEACVENRCRRSPVAGCCNSGDDCPDDGDVCTAETCVENQCLSTPIENCCTHTQQCADSDMCTDDYCDFATNQCVFHNLRPHCCASDAECPDDSDECTSTVCDPERMTCVTVRREGCCTGDSQCHTSSPCMIAFCDTVGNTCVSVPLPECCVDDGDCDDGDACTLDRCATATGQCHNFVTDEEGCCNDAADCDDWDPCTTDSCVDNTCRYERARNCCKSDKDCDDTFACTIDECINHDEAGAGTCRHIDNGLAEDRDECGVCGGDGCSCNYGVQPVVECTEHHYDCTCTTHFRWTVTPKTTAMVDEMVANNETVPCPVLLAPPGNFTSVFSPADLVLDASEAPAPGTEVCLDTAEEETGFSVHWRCCVERRSPDEELCGSSAEERKTLRWTVSDALRERYAEATSVESCSPEGTCTASAVEV